MEQQIDLIYLIS